MNHVEFISELEQTICQLQRDAFKARRLATSGDLRQAKTLFETAWDVRQKAVFSIKNSKFTRLLVECNVTNWLDIKVKIIQELNSQLLLFPLVTEERIQDHQPFKESDLSPIDHDKLQFRNSVDVDYILDLIREQARSTLPKRERETNKLYYDAGNKLAYLGRQPVSLMDYPDEACLLEFLMNQDDYQTFSKAREKFPNIINDVPTRVKEKLNSLFGVELIETAPIKQHGYRIKPKFERQFGSPY